MSDADRSVRFAKAATKFDDLANSYRSNISVFSLQDKIIGEIPGIRRSAAPGYTNSNAVDGLIATRQLLQRSFDLETNGDTRDEYLEAMEWCTDQVTLIVAAGLQARGSKYTAFIQGLGDAKDGLVAVREKIKKSTEDFLFMAGAISAFTKFLGVINLA